MITEDSIKKDTALHVLLILALTAAVFSLSLQNGFVWDDWKLMVNNDAYQTGDLDRIFSEKANGLEYLPVRDLTLLLDYHLWGMNPFGFHLTNLLLYLAGIAAAYKTVSIMAGLAGEREGKFIAFWASVVFALHPLHAEAVNFIAARNNLLAALFLFMSFNVLMAAVYERRHVLTLFSVLLFVLSLFSKVSVIFFPLFLIVVFLYIPGTVLPIKKKMVISALFFVVDAAALSVHFHLASESGMMNEGFVRFGINNNMLLFARAVQIPFFYLKMLIFPYPLSNLYSVSFLSDGFVLRMIAAGMILFALALCMWFWRKRHPLPVLGAAWFIFSLGPVLNFFPTEPVVADRYAYFAVFGFGIVSAYLLRIAVANRRYFLYAACLTGVAWGVVDMSRSRDWHDDLSLWKSALSADPSLTRIELANALWAMGRHHDALAHLREEYDRTGTFRYTQFLGKHAYQMGKYEEAIRFFQKALAEGGDALKDVHLELAMAYEKAGLELPSLEHYLRAGEIKDANPLGKTDQSAREGAERMRLGFMPGLQDLRLRAMNEPANLEVRANLALLLHKIGLYDEAAASYMKLLDKDPGSYQGWYNLGLVFMKLQKHPEAVRAFENSLTIHAQNKEALNNIGICYQTMRDVKQAEYYYRKALALDPGFFYAAFNLGRVYFMQGNAEKAAEYFLLAKSLAGDRSGMVEQYLRQVR